MQGSFILELRISISISSALLLSGYLFQRKQQNGGWKNLTVTTNFKKKITPSSYHMEQKIFIEGNCIFHTHIEKKIFAAATFEGL